MTTGVVSILYQVNPEIKPRLDERFALKLSTVAEPQSIKDAVDAIHTWIRKGDQDVRLYLSYLKTEPRVIKMLAYFLATQEAADRSALYLLWSRGPDHDSLPDALRLCREIGPAGVDGMLLNAYNYAAKGPI